VNNLQVVRLMRTSEVEEDWKVDIEGKLLAGSLSLGLGQKLGLTLEAGLTWYGLMAELVVILVSRNGRVCQLEA
jgi:hypothetical protein